MKTLRVLPSARMDLRRARTYLDEQRDGLGAEFVADFDRTAVFIREYPEGAPEVRPNIRRAQLRRFRYSILYRVELDAVVIVAVMHHRQDPQTWIERL